MHNCRLSCYRYINPFNQDESVHYLSSRTSFEIDLGPYNRVQNVNELIKYRNESKANHDWVYSPEEGPFRALGHDRITKILHEKSDRDPILRLNDATCKLAREIFSQLKSSLANPKSAPPALPVCKKPVVDITTIYDSQGITAFSHCIKKILGGKADFSVIDRFLSFGGNLNSPIQIYYGGHLLKVPPLTYVLCSLSNCESSNKKILELADYLVKHGADINYTFGPNADNMMSILMQQFPSISHMLRWYLENGGDINFKNKEGNTFLHLALFLPGWAPANDIERATKLVEAGSDVSLGNNQGEHPVHLLCRYGYNNEANNTLLETILKIAPGELNVRDKALHSPLYWSIRTGKQLFINTIIKAKPDVPPFADAKNFLAGFAAFIDENSRKIVYGTNNYIFTKEAIENKLNKNYMPLLNSLLPFVGTSPEGLRALLIACEGQTTLLHQFAGSCPWILDHFLKEKYILPEDLQLKNGEGISVEDLGNLTNNSFSMMIACFNLDLKSAQELIKKDFFLDFHLEDSGSFLHKVLIGSKELPNKSHNDWKIGFTIFEMLLARGVNPNLQAKEGGTPLLWAIDIQKTEVNPYILGLIDYGADVDLADNRGMTARKRIGEFDEWRIAKQAILGAPSGS